MVFRELAYFETMKSVKQQLDDGKIGSYRAYRKSVDFDLMNNLKHNRGIKAFKKVLKSQTALYGILADPDFSRLYYSLKYFSENFTRPEDIKLISRILLERNRVNIGGIWMSFKDLEKLRHLYVDQIRSFMIQYDWFGLISFDNIEDECRGIIKLIDFMPGKTLMNKIESLILILGIDGTERELFDEAFY